jgi:DNA-binding MarR family transcriptional regulator
MNPQETYLRAILATVARQTFPPAEILKIMGPNAGEKQFRAYNMCDGTRTQAEIAKELALDSGNFSKSLGRWIDAGIVIRVGEGRDVRPVHLYPLAESYTKKGAQP